MLSNNVTVCIFAFNEQRRLAETAGNFEGVFRVLVVDNFSSDGTRDVAARLGLPVIQVRNPGFIETPEVMDVVQAAVDTEYLLIASCAEVVPGALLEAYAEAANTGSHDVVQALRISITAGLPIPISGTPRRQAYDSRFFRKGAIDYIGNQLHHTGKITVPAERVRSLPRERSDLFFYQFRDYDCSKTETVHCRYDDVLAVQRYQNGERFSLLRCLYRSAGHFLLTYVRNGSFRFGMLGFMHSAYRGIMEFTIQLRIWEHQNGMTLPAVISINSAKKGHMLGDARKLSPGDGPFEKRS